MSICRYVFLYVYVYAYLFHQSASVLVSLSVRTACVYVVAILRRLLKYIFHFCKRAPQKRPIFWKSDLHVNCVDCVLTSTSKHIQ